MVNSMALNISDYDFGEFLENEEDVFYFLECVMDEDPALLPAALREVARARGGMTALARKTGLSRESLYRSLTEESDPRYSTICKIMTAYGVPLAPKRTAVA